MNSSISLSRILSQTVKEIAQFRRDPITVALAFFLPLIALCVYGYATRLEIKNIPVALINHDKGKLSRDYVERLFSNNQMLAMKWDGNDPLKPLDEGEAKATIVIPPDFSKRIRDRKEVTVQAIVDATDVNNARVIKNSVISTTNFFLQANGLYRPKISIKPEIRLWFNPGRDEALYIVPGTIALVLWIFPSLLSGISLAREKEQGTVLQLYASSMTSFELISGKLIAYVGVALIEAIIVLISCYVLFGVWFVSEPISFSINLILFTACAVNFGLLAGAVATTQNAAVQLVATFGFTTTLLLSGFIYPIRNIVYPLSLVSYIVPARYFVESCRDTFVRGVEPFTHWYIPLTLLAMNVVLLMASSKKMKDMQLKV